MTGEEYNHINDVMQDLYQDGKLSEDDFDCICNIIDRADRYDKYKWHDLRKEPTDLPEELTTVNVTWINHEPEHYYNSIKDKPFSDASAIFFKGNWWWWSGTCEDHLKEYNYAPFCNVDEAIEIIAWREIEPFEGV